ncbi:hypothetical protein OESDEN_10081 [Oesophagostomum dentatum]|uniref:Uncharacterized protein n=1 Tax=Oesophagostomum dentatum TaxID=61180 RepID=A0A0B1SXR8_OESDE|nr:hypothetical protein OESDEN_10081 [Oesophagostomum dentatum]
MSSVLWKIPEVFLIQEMWSQIALFLLIAAYAYGAIMQYPVKVGEPVFLNLGNDVKTWKRVRNDDVEEFIQYCGPTEKSPRCGGFVNKARFSRIYFFFN